MSFQILPVIELCYTEINHRIIGYLSTEHTEDTDHRILNGIYTDILGVASQEILEEIFLKNGRGPEINHREFRQN